MARNVVSTSATKHPKSDSRVEPVRISTLRPHPRNIRTHSQKQIRQIAASIRSFGFLNPIIVDDQSNIIAGHGRFDAAMSLGMRVVPIIKVSHLRPTEIRAYMLADNKVAENAGWDREQLATEFEELQIALPEVGLELDITGFEAAEVDQLLADLAPSRSDPTDELPPTPERAVTQTGDLWQLGKHRLLCADSRDPEALRQLMDGECAAAVFCDPPYNVPARSIGGRGRVRHRDFAYASGEMSQSEFRDFLATTLGNAVHVSRDGAAHFVCMDWRHIADLIEVGCGVYGEMLNLVVWTKSNAGQGSFYRSQHELIGVFRVGDARHRNNVELGRFGRNRSNVWAYAGANTFGRDRLKHLAMHPTVKPVALVSDALLDCTTRGDCVLDIFGGSGTLILAAEKVGRRAQVIEIDPRYIDIAITRWQSATKLQARLSGDGRSFEEVTRAREAIDSGSRQAEAVHRRPPQAKKTRLNAPRNNRGNASRGGQRG